MAFFGQETVLADLDLHKDMAGLVTTGTLSRYIDGTYDPANDVAYANVCLWPGTTHSSLGIGGGAYDESAFCAWRTGESEKPRGQDKWTVAGVEYLIETVASRLNDDESEGYAIYDCQVSRPA